MNINPLALDAFLEHKRRLLHLPGLAIAVVQDGRIIYLRGLGIAGPKRSMTPQTPLIIGSLSKSFTALAVMQLAERDLLNLDEPVQHYVPWFRLADTDASASITIRHLLTHTSGISRYAGRRLLAGRGKRSIEQGVRDLTALKLSKPVGTVFEYSNTNYLIAGLVVEVVSGLAFGAYVQQHVFGPLGMLKSYISENEALCGGLAHGYRWWFGIPFPFRAPYLSDALPAAFIAASSEDMARYALALLNNGALDDATLLSPNGVTALHQPLVATTSPSSLYALGWRVEKLSNVSIRRHSGEVSNFISEMVLVPSRGLGAIALTNTGNGLVPAVVPEISRIASDMVRFLLGIPAPRRRVSFLCFYALLDVALVMFSLYQCWSLTRLLRRSNQRRGLLLGLASLIEASLGAVVTVCIPRLADAPWSLLRLYVPDVTAWLAAFFGCSLLKSFVFLLRRKR